MFKLPTPSTSHIPSDSPIYEPSEDSFLFLDTLSSSHEVSFLQPRFSAPTPVPIVLEIGTGSGVVLAFVTANAHHIFGHANICTLGTDVNATACQATRLTVAQAVEDARPPATASGDYPNASALEHEPDVNHQTQASSSGHFLDTLNCDLTSSIRPGSIDMLIFNPPYVPTESLPLLPSNTVSTSQSPFEKESHLLSLAYAGGTDGMEVTSRLLAELPTILSERGAAYILFCARNKPLEVREHILSWPEGHSPIPWRWNCVVAGESGGKGGFERLTILRIWREQLGT